jgi:hypothetical protein
LTKKKNYVHFHNEIFSYINCRWINLLRFCMAMYKYIVTIMANISSLVTLFIFYFHHILFCLLTTHFFLVVASLRIYLSQKHLVIHSRKNYRTLLFLQIVSSYYILLCRMQYFCEKKLIDDHYCFRWVVIKLQRWWEEINKRNLTCTCTRNEELKADVILSKKTFRVFCPLSF